jgi:hypothetical protein
MAIGNNELYPGLSIPKLGQAHMQQDVAGQDLLTLSLLSGATDDLLVLRKGTTEAFVVQDGGNVVMTQNAAGDVGLKILRASTPTTDAIKIADNGDGTTKQWKVTKNYNMLPRVYTTRPTTGLTKGEVMVLFHGSTPKFGICSSTAAQTIKLIRARTKTFGRLTA